MVFHCGKKRGGCDKCFQGGDSRKFSQSRSGTCASLQSEWEMRVSQTSQCSSTFVSGGNFGVKRGVLE